MLTNTAVNLTKKETLKFELFPYFLMRVGNGNITNLHKLNFQVTDNEIEKYNLSEKKRTEQKESLCIQLYKKIGLVQDIKFQNILLSLKRNIFNDKLIEEDDFNTLNLFFSEDIMQSFYVYNDFFKELKNQKQALGILLETETTNIKGDFWELINNDNLKKGLLVSSVVLFEEVNKFIHSKTSIPKKKENQLELSLLKYLSRIHTKTSPLGLFTSIGCGSMVELTQSTLFFAEKKYSAQSKVRINNFIFRHLNYLWFNNRTYSRFFSIKKNPTIDINNGSYNFLSTTGNVDSFQIIGQNDFLNYLFELPFDNESICINSIIKSLLDKKIFDEDEKENIEDYIYNLFSIGFLEFDLGVIGSDPLWYKKMSVVFQNINNSNFIETISLLKSIENSLNEFEQANPEKGKMIIDELSLKLNNYINELGAELNISLLKTKEEQENKNTNNGEDIKDDPYHIDKQNILKIDSKLQNKFSFNIKIAEQIIEKLDELVSLLSDFNYFKKDRELILSFFKEKYSPNQCVNILTLYNDFFKHYKVPLEQMKKGENFDNNTQENFIDLKSSIGEKWNLFYNEAGQYFNNTIQNINNSMIVNISIGEIKKNLFPDAHTKEKKGSWGTHIQICATRNQANDMDIKAVINSVFPGYGKLASRFLYLFENSVTQEFYNWNGKLAEENEILIDNKDSNYFNANIHPRMLPYELYTPGINRKNEKYEISVKDMEVMYNEGCNKLDVRSKTTGKFVNFFDLGFELDESRSNLFGFINLFSFSEWPNLFPIITSINRSYSNIHGNADANIKYQPRIVCDDILILQRKSWMIHKSLIPSQDKNESILDYYIRLINWKNELLIPTDIFISIPKNDEKITPKDKKKSLQDDYKPLYISFKSPLFLKLFQKILSRADEFIKFEEMLPNTDNMLNNDNEKRPSEFLFQWYKYKSK